MIHRIRKKTIFTTTMRCIQGLVVTHWSKCHLVFTYINIWQWHHLFKLCLLVKHCDNLTAHKHRRQQYFVKEHTVQSNQVWSERWRPHNENEYLPVELSRVWIWWASTLPSSVTVILWSWPAGAWLILLNTLTNILHCWKQNYNLTTTTWYCRDTINFFFYFKVS